MFWHIFKYRIKCITRDKQMMFWTLLFPIVLATFFNMAFANLGKIDLFSSIKIAVVDNETYRADVNMQNFLKSMSVSTNKTDEQNENAISNNTKSQNDNNNKSQSEIINSKTESQSGITSEKDNSDNKSPLIVTIVSSSKANQLLNDGEVSGILELKDNLNLYFKTTGISQTIIKSIFDHYIQTSSMVMNIISQNPKVPQIGLFDDISKENSFFKSESDGPISPDTTVIYFYTVLAMACFYGGFLGMKEIETIQADLSPQAARVNLSPLHKFKVFISSIAAASLIQILVILILISYIAFVIKIDFGNQIGYLLLLCISGSIMGVSFGAMVCALVKGGQGIKTGILIGTSMTLSFLSGMMFVQVKYIVTSAVPAMAYINPLNVITDAFYVLYYYPTHTRYFMNIGIIWLFILIFSGVTVMRLRRLKYASI